jgi:hypothetical protein
MAKDITNREKKGKKYNKNKLIYKSLDFSKRRQN